MATAPTPKSPVGGAQIDSLAAHFTWDALPGTKSYRLQVAADDAFSQLVVDSNIGATNDVTVFNVIPPTGASMYWRVQAEGDAGWSAPERFTAARDNVEVAPAHPTPSTTASSPVQTDTPASDTDVRPPDYLTGTTSTGSLAASVVVMVATIIVVLIVLLVGTPGM